MEEIEIEKKEFRERVISIRRVTKVVKGGKNLNFSALIAIGDESGRVAIGKGKAREVPIAIKKAIEDAKKHLIKVPIVDGSIPHLAKGEFGAGLVILRPASKGTGVIAGGAVRAIIELAGIKDILTKCVGSKNPFSSARATIEALKSLRDHQTACILRGKLKEEGNSGEKE